MTSVPKVTIGLVLYSGIEYLKYSVPSLVFQDYPNLEILLRDQSLEGQMSDYIRSEMSSFLDKIQIQRGENLWHSGGHNALIQQMTGEYYLCASNDMLYSHTLVSEMVTEMEKSENQPYGSATCKLMQWDFAEAEAGGSGFTNRMDSVGLRITKGHQCYDTGQGEVDSGQYDDLKDVFGPSGALAMYRKKALEDIAYKNETGQVEYFDEWLHYKNDVDLAYRLQWAGHSCLLVPQLGAYHDRQVARHTRKSSWMKQNSLFGHLIVLQKNTSPDFSFSVRFLTWLMNVARWLHAALFDRSLLKQYHLVSKHRCEIQSKKRVIKKQVNAKTIEQLMG